MFDYAIIVIRILMVSVAVIEDESETMQMQQSMNSSADSRLEYVNGRKEADAPTNIFPESEQCVEAVHPYRNDAATNCSTGKPKREEGFILFPKIIKFNTYLISRYGNHIEAELEEMFIDGELTYICEEIGLNMRRVNRITCSITPRMTLWRVNRYEFIADVEVSVRADTWSENDIELDVAVIYASRIAVWMKSSAIPSTASASISPTDQ